MLLVCGRNLLNNRYDQRLVFVLAATSVPGFAPAAIERFIDLDEILQLEIRAFG